ncbi:MAG TPA: hypothetical protein VFI95_22915 [Terriglobales bacterium]|nr:hypothetical protein [Terriglobales bacterium]
MFTWLERGPNDKITVVTSVMARKLKKFASEIDAKVYDEMVRVAKQNGQSQRHIIEKALEHYLHNVVPSQRPVRRAVMNAFERSVTRNRDLLERLAK